MANDDDFDRRLVIACFVLFSVLLWLLVWLAFEEMFEWAASE